MNESPESAELQNGTMTTSKFLGQQEGERVLYVITPHPIAEIMGYVRLFGLVLLILLGSFGFRVMSPVMFTFGVLLGLIVALIGAFLTHAMNSKRVAYLTDRRLVRFEPTNVFAINSRAITWDETAKVKTFPPNVWYRVFNVGNITVHAGSTIINVDTAMQKNIVNNDDLDLRDVYYYKDLGNYIDKILYLYKHSPSEIVSLRPFVPKPRGQRY